ncbi:MAG: response regulator [Sedimentisphaerales bacterium]|nr:response regulator [Sedimentisphaerales bacterium]
MSRLDFSAVYSDQRLPDPWHVNRQGVIEELWPAYVDTVVSHLSELEQAALSMEAEENVEQNSGAIRRLLHSIKGDSGMAGVIDIYELCHEAECAFDELSGGPARADMVLRVKDWIESAVRIIQNGGEGRKVEREQEEKAVRRKKIKALVIDDDRVCRQRIKMLIGEFCECTMARDGRVGYETFVEAFEKDCPFQLVTLDIQMSEMDGHETLSAIRLFEQQRGIGGLEGVKIIMTTSQDTSNHIFSAFREGCEAYVVKKDIGEKLLEEMANLGLLKVKPDYSIV